MHEALKEIEKLQPNFDERIMGAINAEQFHKLLARLLDVILGYRQQPGTKGETAQLILKAHGLLEKVGRHHLNDGVVATLKTVNLYHECIEELSWLLRTHLGVDENLVAESEKLNQFRIALVACSIPEGTAHPFFSRWDKPPDADAQSQALTFARDHIEESSRLAYALGGDRNALSERLPTPERTGWIALFQQVRLLTGQISFIPR